MRRACIVLALLAPVPASASGPHALSFDLIGHVSNAPLAGAPADGRRTLVSKEAAAALIAAMQSTGGVPIDHARVELAANEHSVPFKRTSIRSYLGVGEALGEVAPRTLQVGLFVTATSGPGPDEVSYDWRHTRLTGPARGFREVERGGVKVQEPVVTECSGRGRDSVPLHGVVVQRSGDEVAFLAWD